MSEVALWRDGRRYTAKEDRMIMQLSFEEAAERLGRPLAAITMRRAALEKYRARLVAQRKACAKATYCTGKVYTAERNIIAPNAMAERDRRLAVDRTLDNLINGTPLKGYSALDRRIVGTTIRGGRRNG